MEALCKESFMCTIPMHNATLGIMCVLSYAESSQRALFAEAAFIQLFAGHPNACIKLRSKIYKINWQEVVLFKYNGVHALDKI